MAKRIFKVGLVILLVVFIAGEIIGRVLGLRNLSLYRADEDYEYIAKPNQDLRIYGNKFVTNAFSMRSGPVSDNDSCTILLIGDSIIYGGHSIDQDSLATARLERALRARFKQPVKILNISAQSWGPDNGAAYLKKHGLFNAKMIILVYSSHDAYDVIDFKTEVGAPPYYTSNHLLAWQTIIDKAWPPIKKKIFGASPTPTLSNTAFNPGFDFFDSLANKEGIPVALYLHCEKGEIKRGLYDQGGQQIKQFCENARIPLYEGLAVEKESFYDDYIHFNNEGQAAMAKVLYDIAEKRFPATK